MSIIRAVVRNGRIEPKEPLTLPDGTEVNVSLADSDITSDDDWDTSPEAIEARLAAMDQLEPLFDNDADREAFEKALQDMKESELAQWDAYTNKLKQLFQ